MKHLHAGETAAGEKLTDVVGDKTEVFGNDLRLGILFCNRAEERNTGSRIPFAVLGGRLAVGNVIVSRKAAEVVNAENVIELES